VCRTKNDTKKDDYEVALKKLFKARGVLNSGLLGAEGGDKMYVEKQARPGVE